MDDADRRARTTPGQLGHWSALIREIAVAGGGVDVVYGYARRIADLRDRHELAQSRLRLLLLG